MSSTVIPSLRYQDAPKAVDWLKRAFGFEPIVVVDGEGGIIEHAQLVHGAGMVMLGSVRPGEYDDLVTTTAQTGKPTAGFYVIVADVDGHAAQAETAGAEILLPPQDQDYGGRVYTCRDFEGNVWSFGNYDPWSQG